MAHNTLHGKHCSMTMQHVS